VTWFNDLASGLGVPAGAVTLAVGIYGACKAAESAAKPAALAEIAAFLDNRTLLTDLRPSAPIYHLFTLTFGSRHLSLRCIASSLIASTIMFISIGLLYNGRLSYFADLFSAGYTLLVWVLLFPLADYISLAKTRMLLKSRLCSAGHRLSLLAVFILDLIGAVAISSVTLYLVGGVFGLVGGLIRSPSDVLPVLEAAFWPPIYFASSTEAYSGVGWFFVTGVLSTIFTSLWTGLIAVSVSMIAALWPIHRVVTWLFDIQQHPLQAIGIICATIIFVVSGVWSLLAAI
jgi:hypothetical protein